MNTEQLPELSPKSLISSDPAAVAAAEAVKARIQSAYVMALHKPRNVDQARTNILKACKRPGFAERVEFTKPIGKTEIRGPSIRFAELALREWRNILTETQIVYEDEKVRRIKVYVTDLESNSTHSEEIVIEKTVERRNPKDREIIAERTNSRGEKVYVVKATEDELHNKEAALVSKAIRNQGLRLIPSDIIDEAIETARATLRNRDAKDPDAAKKAVIDAFSELNIDPQDLEEYLGHKLDFVSPLELEKLRAIYRSIRDGEAQWIDYIKERSAPEKEPEHEELEIPPIEEILSTLIENTLPPSDHELFRQFLKEREEQTGSTNLTPYVVEHFRQYLEAFNGWKELKEARNRNNTKPEPEKAASTEEEPVENQWEAWTSTWVNLRRSQDPKKGFRGYVVNNLDKFKTAPQNIRNRAKRKWETLYPDEPWPLDETSEPPRETKTVLDERPTISCPRENGDEVLIEYCNNACGHKDICDAYKEYYEKINL